MNTIARRIIDISYKYKLSHLGSCLTAYPIIDHIYNTRKPEEKFVLSAGHAGLALYCVLEAHGGKNAEEIFNHHGVHPDRCLECGIDCSSGSLGHGIGIACGMALADRTKKVHCLVSDGEMAEGSVWEALRIIKEQNLDNLKLHLNFNGYGAYRTTKLEDFINIEGITIWNQNFDPYPFLRGQDAHYMTLSKQQYEIIT